VNTFERRAFDKSERLGDNRRTVRYGFEGSKLEIGTKVRVTVRPRCWSERKASSYGKFGADLELIAVGVFMPDHAFGSDITWQKQDRITR
jgi:hypothetical protein